MAPILWNENFSIQVSDFDSQHQVLINLLNEFDQVVKLGEKQEVIYSSFKQFVYYIGFHFIAEEKNMQVYNYPGLPQHKAEHDKLIENVLEIENYYAAGKQHITEEVVDFLSKWSVNHIEQCDRNYGRFKNRKGF